MSGWGIRGWGIRGWGIRGWGSDEGGGDGGVAGGQAQAVPGECDEAGCDAVARIVQGLAMVDGLAIAHQRHRQQPIMRPELGLPAAEEYNFLHRGAGVFVPA